MKMTLRLPAQVHKALANEAEDGGKSLNQVIVDRLNASLGGVYVTEAQANDARVIQRIEKLEARVAELENGSSLEGAADANSPTGNPSIVASRQRVDR